MPAGEAVLPEPELLEPELLVLVPPPRLMVLVEPPQPPVSNASAAT
jgi:hypothetical protein